MTILLFKKGKANSGGTRVQGTASSFFSIPLCIKFVLMMMPLRLSLFLEGPDKSWSHRETGG